MQSSILETLITAAAHKSFFICDGIYNQADEHVFSGFI